MPSGEFSPGMYAARIVRAVLKDVDDLLDQVLEAGADRRPTAGITAFDEWARTHKHSEFYLAVFRQSMDDVERLLRTCVDMAESIAVLMETNGPSFVSPLVLSRSLGEAVMRVCHVIAADVPPQRTLARMAAFQLEAVEGNLRAAQMFGAQAAAEGARALDNIAEMQDWLKREGFELGPHRVKPFTAWIKVDGQTENIEFNATDAYKRYMPMGVWHWNLGSGVTHSRGWMLPSVAGAGDDAPLSSLVELFITVTDVVLELGDALARAGAAHTALDVDWFHKKNHLRRRGMLSLAKRNNDIAVDHREYAARGPDWVYSETRLGDAFLKRRRK